MEECQTIGVSSDIMKSEYLQKIPEDDISHTSVKDEITEKMETGIVTIDENLKSSIDQVEQLGITCR